jgi:hypothetical protein
MRKCGCGKVNKTKKVLAVCGSMKNGAHIGTLATNEIFIKLTKKGKRRLTIRFDNDDFDKAWKTFENQCGVERLNIIKK